MSGDRVKKQGKWMYNGDGRFKRDRIKGKDKRYLRRWRRRHE